jgi:hypothetical protein
MKIYVSCNTGGIELGVLDEHVQIFWSVWILVHITKQHSVSVISF